MSATGSKEIVLGITLEDLLAATRRRTPKERYELLNFEYKGENISLTPKRVSLDDHRRRSTQYVIGASVYGDGYRDISPDIAVELMGDLVNAPFNQSFHLEMLALTNWVGDYYDLKTDTYPHIYEEPEEGWDAYFKNLPY